MFSKYKVQLFLKIYDKKYANSKDCLHVNTNTMHSIKILLYSYILLLVTNSYTHEPSILYNYLKCTFYVFNMLLLPVCALVLVKNFYVFNSFVVYPFVCFVDLCMWLLKP